MNDPYLPPSVPEVAPPAVLSSEERNWAMAGHLSALSGWLTGFGYIAGPLIVWLIKKDTMPFVAREAKEALNFNISWTIWLILLAIVAFILTFFVIGVLLWPVVALIPVGMSVLSIVGGVRANEGNGYRYPLTLRFIQ
ncbi:DUF4870 domain-containing protein [Luteolibacter sp. GHJ8]|uniref:DUF4870 domain-containing protein n=1 Tax=Luteolibacter rhizosphaerae TaxID=2989719 RepID=A0ABT3G459_9BACT|nr:DUF4870 domain-containing protein [Luteolibacter rhizosphaerae]MCW1914635.1 DUF4870 domain-containing protein [Luteolibacter rhizosphaerae]